MLLNFSTNKSYSLLRSLWSFLKLLNFERFLLHFFSENWTIVVSLSRSLKSSLLEVFFSATEALNLSFRDFFLLRKSLIFCLRLCFQGTRLSYDYLVPYRCPLVLK